MTQSDSTTTHHADIAIIGAGMVGTALALSLKDTSLSIALVDGQKAEYLQASTGVSDSVENFKPRVSALTGATQHLLKVIGAWDSINPLKILPYQKMNVWDHLGSAEINFDAAELYCDALGFIVENQTLVSALHQRVKNQDNLATHFACSLEKIKTSDLKEGGHILSLNNGQEIHCNLLVAADGANSKVRNTLGMATREWDYQHHAIVATVETEKPHGKVARQRFSESGPLAFLPLQDEQSSEKFCSIVWSVQADQAEELMAQSDASFKQSLENELESRLGKLQAVSKRYSYPLRQRHAKSYIQPGVVLIGDAAHTIHPLAGQGVNLGFKDVKALSQILIKANQQDIQINHPSLLRRYNRERQGDNLIMMGVMEGFKRVFEQKDPIVRWLRNAGLNWVDKQALLKKQIVLKAMGLSR